VFVGTDAGAALIEQVRALMTSQATSFAGRTTIPELGALFALADLAILPDTGALHVARGARVPTVVIAWAGVSPHHWMPQAVETCVLLSRPGLCQPICATGRCETRACMAAISADAVTAAAEDLLDRYPPLTGRDTRMAACLSAAAPPPIARPSFWTAFQ